MRTLTTILLLLCCARQVRSQEITGYWYGSGHVENGGSSNNYMFELVLEQNGPRVNAILNYFFKQSYRSFRLKGSYLSTNRSLTLYNVPITYHNSPSSMEVDCPMDLLAQVRISRVDAHIKGALVSKGTYRNTCPAVMFDLLQNREAGNLDSVKQAIAQFKESNQLWKPGSADTLVALNVVQLPQKSVAKLPVVSAFENRGKEVLREIEVDADSLDINFYDNGEVDGDSISVFLNGRMLTYKQLLSTRALHFYIGLDTAREYDELSMFANNLGRIPPNTALMTIWDGIRRHDIRMTSTLQKNATIRIRRRKTP